MGWMFQYGKPADVKAEIERLCTWDSDRSLGRPLKVMNYGSTYYAAVKATLLDPLATCSDFELDDTRSYVFGAIFLTQISNGDWGYKDMDEAMGPNASRCPKGVLNLLSPTTSENALRWRERCRRPRLQPKTGDRVRIKEAWDPYGTDFEKIEYGRRRGVYRSLKTGTPVRLSRWQLNSAERLA